MHTQLKYTRLFIIVLGLIGLLVVGCGSNTDNSATPESTGAEDGYTISLLIPNDTNPFFVTLQEGAEEAAARLNSEIVVRQAGDDLTTQQGQINEMIDLEVDAMIIIPVDGSGVVSELEAADAAGIAVFTVDRSADTAVVVAHIASDNEAGGRMAADYLAETVNEKGNVVELTGTAGTSAARDRGLGFNEGLASYPDITIVAQETGDFGRDQGQAAFADILASEDDIVGVFAHNDEMILGARLAAEEAGRADEMVFVGFDAIDDAITALENDQINATIAQQPGEMGRLGVETAVKHLNGEEVPDYIPVELALITN
ncbi:MAG: substrate-binding domain-containing protein [Ardenticatenaceae bacterium]|nr:substrate-binding domain-containing protein [Anaerolineales bacterium]MCB8923095.1 substrate-binding domain-containing protein [Ardenticatenaceae bacterium]MCB8990038.1 substrate-binding domain-containing protein [Ardenticatenaceae bacterium]